MPRFISLIVYLISAFPLRPLRLCGAKIPISQNLNVYCSFAVPLSKTGR